MARRERTAVIRCAEPGCRDNARYAYSSQREYGEIMQSQQRYPYKCTRHHNPDSVLRPDNTSTTHVLVASKVFHKGPYDAEPAPLRGLFWLLEGSDHGSGFVFGPGFNAHADDFPEGTRLVVTTRIELPGAVA